MASIRKRSWVGSKGERKEAWRLSYIDGAGKTRTKQFSRKAAAESYRVKVEGEIAAGVHVADAATATVKTAADLWVARAQKRGRERSTVKQYKEHRDIHIVPRIGAKKLSRLTAPDVEAFVDDLLEAMSEAMASKVVRSLASIIREAQRRGLVGQNVAQGVRVVRSSRNRPKPVIPTRDHLRLMLATAEAEFPDFRPLLITAIFTGLRSSELRGLGRDHISLRVGEITVEQRADAWGVLGEPKSAAGRRSVPIPPIVISELRRWMLKAPRSSDGLLFPNGKGGTRLHSNMLAREYYPLQIAAGLTKTVVGADGKPTIRALYDFHALRHAAASAWIKQKVDLKRLTTWLGHSSVAITLDTYGHLIVDEAGDAAIVAAAQADLLA